MGKVGPPLEKFSGSAPVVHIKLRCLQARNELNDYIRLTIIISVNLKVLSIKIYFLLIHNSASNLA